MATFPYVSVENTQCVPSKHKVWNLEWRTENKLVNIQKVWWMLSQSSGTDQSVLVTYTFDPPKWHITSADC